MQHFFTENQWTETWNICWTIKAARNRWTQIHKYVTILCFQVTDKYIALKFMRFLHKNCLFGPYYTTYRYVASFLYSFLPGPLGQCISVTYPTYPRRTANLVPRFSLLLRERTWLQLVTWLPKSGSQNKRGEVEEIMVAMTKVIPSGPERSLPPLY